MNYRNSLGFNYLAHPAEPAAMNRTHPLLALRLDMTPEKRLVRRSGRSSLVQ